MSPVMSQALHSMLMQQIVTNDFMGIPLAMSNDRRYGSSNNL